MKVLIGLPAYNEELGIANVLKNISALRSVSRYELQALVVDDGSMDDTAQVVRNYARNQEYVRLITHNRNRGLGEAVKTIFSYAFENLEDEDILITMDADNTHRPMLIESMIGRLICYDLDLVVASRFTTGGCELGLRALRKFYSRGAMCFFKLFFPIQNLNDYSSGYRAYRVRILKEAKDRWKELITTNGFDCMAEIAAKFSKMGIKAGEVPLMLNYELKEGASKMKVARTVKGYFSLLAKVR